MELNKEHITALYNFTKQHHVVWYDLQSELVDHLANDIEQIWEKEPHLSFEKAKNKAFKKFGVFGFMDIVDKRKAYLNKRYWKLVWTAFKQFLGIPKIVFTGSLIYFMVLLLRYIKFNKTLLFILLILVLIIPIYTVIKNNNALKIKQLKTGKKWLFEENLATLGGFAIALNLPFQIMLSLHNNSLFSSNTKIWLFASFIVIYCIILYLVTIKIPPKIREILAKENPEYQIF